MRTFRTRDTLTGWAVFGVALTAYTLTLEPTVSYWDSGEFIASAYKLQVPHPPGAPLYLLLGRLFALFALGNLAQVAWWVNWLSAVASAGTVLFLCWTITLLARKALVPVGGEPRGAQQALILAAGVVGGLAFTFTDSFWFSAVEAEVYALSVFFTAAVVWAMLRWEQVAAQPHADKWLLLIMFLVGLSIGVHLLNLLTIPALALIFYFRSFRFSRLGVVAALTGSGLLLGIILWGVIPGLPALAGALEVLLVNAFGLPFGTGVLLFALLLAGGLVWGLWYAQRHQRRLLHTGLLGFVYVLIGYSSYLIIPLRSAYNPPIDENNPEHALSFVTYLKREQYGDRPLLYGPQFNAQLLDQREGAPRYVRTATGYEVGFRQLEPVYDPKDLTLLPRLYSEQPQHLRAYQKWVDVRPGQKPSFGQNLTFLWNYQFLHMYGRYFLWNFVGRASDVQQAGVLWPWQTDWGLPPKVAQNQARNQYFALPLLLGLLGLGFQARRSRKDAWVVGLLFLCTGAAIVLYLNQGPLEPRERDYSFAGSFYAFALWIGLGVPAVAELLRQVRLAERGRVILAAGLSQVVPVVLAAQGWDDHDRSDRYGALLQAKNMLASCDPNAILFTNGDNDTFPLWYAQEVEGIRTDVRVAVLSYLNTDWYVEQMRRSTYESAPWPLSLGQTYYRQGTNDVLPLVERPQVKDGIDVGQYLDLIRQRHPALQVTAGTGRAYTSLPSRKLVLAVDAAKIRKSGIVPPERLDRVESQLTMTLTGSLLEKKHLLLLDLLHTNNWERPIYFSYGVNQADVLGLESYFQTEGLTYRLLPVRSEDPEAVGEVATEMLYRKLLHEFSYTGLDNPRVYLDENALRLPGALRDRFAQLATALLAQGDTRRAREVLAFCETKIPFSAVPPDMNAAALVVPLAQVGERQKAITLLHSLAREAEEGLAHYASQGNLFGMEMQLHLITLQRVYLAALQLGLTQQATAYEQTLRRYLRPG